MKTNGKNWTCKKFGVSNVPDLLVSRLFEGIAVPG